VKQSETTTRFGDDNMKNRWRIAIFIVLVVCFVYGPRMTVTLASRNTTKVTGIVRIIVNDSHEFSFVVMNDKGVAEIRTYKPTVGIKFKFDVPDGQRMWMESDYKESWFMFSNCTWMMIHVHSAEDINGAGRFQRVW
jgi:hypothetical protein